MKQADLIALAHDFTRSSIGAMQGDTVWIEYQGSAARLIAQACAVEVIRAGALPLVRDRGRIVINRLLSHASEQTLFEHGAREFAAIQKVQCCIRIRDDAEEALIPMTPLRVAYDKAMKPFNDHIVDNTRRLITRAPSEAFAKVNGMALDQFEDYYQRACYVIRPDLEPLVEPLRQLMSDTVHMRMTGDETDMELWKRGIGAVACTGRRNRPDGECYTAPEKFSVRGHAKFKQLFYKGQRFHELRLEFDKGRIVKATAEDAERTRMVNRLLDIDEGARYLGEVALGFNPVIKQLVGNVLFDEKADGNFHIAAGRAYRNAASNGNASVIHWDMYNIQRPEYGGGDVWFDNGLVRRNGRFVVPDLQALNPEALLPAIA